MAQNQDVVLIKIEDMIKDMISRGPAAEEPFSMFRVPVHLRTYKNNERYFEPRLVSIGPYHWKKDHLRAMEMHKGRYFIDFTDDHPDKREKYIEKIRSLLPSIKKCYFESINEDDLNDDDFVEMLLLDGCFILYFLIKLYDLRDRSDPLTAHHQTSTSSARSSSLDRNEMNPVVVDPVFNVGWNFPLISTDMLMLENQIPFIILEELYQTYSRFESSRNQNKDLHELVFNFVRRVARTKKEELVIPSVDKNHKIHHLLHFYYEAYIPAMQYSTNNPYPLVLRPREKYRYPRMIPCATELQEFGITFMRKKDPNNFMDISFERGVLKIPYTAIEETTKSKYMNLVAFEQCSGIENKNMTSYILFMDFLLNTRDDVIVLQRDGIIENKLANEDDVTEFFSQFNGCCYIRFDEHYLAPLFRDIKEYCEAFWPKHRAKLYRDYFGNPWAIFSLCAALLVLSITVFRTICFILSAFFKYDLN